MSVVSKNIGNKLFNNLAARLFKPGWPVAGPTAPRNIVPDDARRQTIEDYSYANYPKEMTGILPIPGLYKFFENSTFLYPNNVPLYADGLDKWRPGCGVLRLWHQFFGEMTYSRFDQNSKVIIVDGPKFAGKTKLAKELAVGLNMRYFPKVEETWAQEVMFNGEVKPDWKWNMFTSKQKFYEDPRSACGHSARLMCWTFECAFRQYINNVLHTLGTGQGVVMEKSAWSMPAYKDALLEAGYITPRFHNWMSAKERWLLGKLMPPHLLIYLDVSPDETYRRIQEHGNAYQKKVEKKYVESVDKYNKVHLPRLNKNFNTVTIQYDWNKPGSSEQVLDDFELLEFTGVKYWDEYSDNDMFELRIDFQKKHNIEYDWLGPGTQQPEIAFTPDYIEQFRDEMMEHINHMNWSKQSWFGRGDKQPGHSSAH